MTQKTRMADAAASDDEPSQRTSSSERSLRVLGAVAAAGQALSLATLCEVLQLPKPTVHRLCAQLMASGFLIRGIDERSFAAGPALRRLALDTLNNGGIAGLRKEVLSELVAEVGETCNFTTLDGSRVLYIDRVEADWPLRLALDIGSHVPLHCTASGKLLLAAAPPSQRETLLTQITLQRYSRTTITSLRALRAELEEIERLGYATDREEFIAGMIAVAVPVSDAQGRVRAALAVHAPSVRMSLEQAIRASPTLKRAAERLSLLL